MTLTAARTAIRDYNRLILDDFNPIKQYIDMYMEIEMITKITQKDAAAFASFYNLNI